MTDTTGVQPTADGKRFSPSASRRVWTHSRDDWLPNWAQRWGWPHHGGDEWGRRVLTVGVWFAGYVSWAYRTCWCLDCHLAREQTYRWMGDAIRRAGGES